MKPPFRWTGGKARLVSQLTRHLPRDWSERRYVDPFFGGGALFFALAGADQLFTWAPQRALLSDACVPLISDACVPLIAAYAAIAEDRERLIRVLKFIETSRGVCAGDLDQLKAWFERVRRRAVSLVNDDPTSAAANFIAVNQMGFNGLWRVNQKGACNTALDSSKAAVDLVRRDLLAQVTVALAGAEIVCQDYSTIVAEAGEGDLLFTDPPYVDLPGRAPSYTGWVPRRWTLEDTGTLWTALVAARDRGAHVIHTNHDHPMARGWAQRVGFEVHPVQVRRSVAQNKGRGDVDELIIVGRPS